MSISVAALVRRRKVGSPTKKSVLLHMADSASDDGSGIWTSKANIARDLELSKRAVQLAIQDMIEAGLVIEVGDKACKYGFTVEYRIVVSAVEALGNTRELGSPGRPKKGMNEVHPVNEVHPTPCTTFTPTREPGSPKPSLEPSGNRQQPREAAPVVVDAQPSRREEVLALMGCDPAGITPQGRFTGTTNDMQEPPKWDAIGLSRAEQDDKIREMLASKRAKHPGFVPNTWGWFTTGMSELAESKSRPTNRIASAETSETAEQRRARRRRMIGA